MSCSNCGNNSLTGCGCSDNCPNQSSEINFDGVFNSINVPDGSNLNDVLSLLEDFVIITVSGLDLSYTVAAGNCLGIPAGEYGYEQIFDALISGLCALNIEVDGLADAFAAFEITINSQILDIQNDINDIQNDITNINISLTDNMPIGSMLMYPVAVPPGSKWELCEGQTLATASFPDLFSAIGYNFGGAGLFFSLPDLRSKFIAGYDAIAAPEYQTIGQGGGQDDVTLTVSQIPKHKHVVGNVTDGATMSSPGNHRHDGGYSFNGIAEGGDIPAAATWDIDEGGDPGPVFKRTAFPFADGDHTHAGVTGDGTSAGLDGTSHENRPSFVVFPWIIKVLN